MPYPITNRFGISKPTYRTGTSISRRSGFVKSVITSSDAGLRALRLRIRYERVSPESMMSSTTSTSLPATLMSRSLRIRTTPEETVAAFVVGRDLRAQLDDALLERPLLDENLADALL